ncbi:hypothetical protein [Luteipulveratus flavus]|uniref:Secreted protein n=1 Tax=Luteipulveratus flavus TaxID=3031728 RepID=A0ABT6C9Q1_9MICO|nr:hypothetical protein [Luteipulveratus sp. YIM 133296]MDF8265598.1 hypothetical protein [Luteipulveratus sp. YIM 133296]
MNRSTRLALCAVALAGVSLGSSQLVAWGDDSEPPPYSEAATESPEVTEPVQLLDGVTLNTAIWDNFQNTVQLCMSTKGWVYEKPPAPNWWQPQYDESGDPVGEEPPFREPAPINLAPRPEAGATPTDSYLTALRGTDSSPESNGTREYIAHDGINSPLFGSVPAETGGCEAAGREAVTIPAIDAKNQLTDQVVEAVTEGGTSPEDITSLDDIAEEVSSLPSSDADALIADNETLIDEAGGSNAD